MGTTHKAQAGDHAARIAATHGFGNYETVWNAEANAALREKRPNPNTLLPGDEVAIPDKAPKTAKVATGAPAVFKLNARALRLRVKLQDFLGRPLANAGCSVSVDGGPAEPATTDQDGLLDRPLDARAAKVTVAIGDRTIDLFPGFLPPIDERAGVLERLVNLGYLEDREDEEAVKVALQELQADKGLPISGELDEATRAALLETYGC
jgi:hypothetical protein